MDEQEDIPDFLQIPEHEEDIQEEKHSDHDEALLLVTDSGHLMDDETPKSRLHKKKVFPQLNISSLFNSTHTPDKLDINLLRILDKDYEQARIDVGFIDDKFSVFDLRIIIKRLNLISKFERMPRKAELVSLLQNYINQPHVVEKSKNLPPSSPKEHINRAKRVQKANVIPTEEIIHSIGVRTTRSKVNNEKEEIKPVSSKAPDVRISALDVPPATLDQASIAVGILQKMNHIVDQLSKRVTELERALSILIERTTEAESYVNSV